MQKSSSKKGEIKGVVHKWQMREKTIPTDLLSKHEVCFMMKYAFKVMTHC